MILTALAHALTDALGPGHTTRTIDTHTHAIEILKPHCPYAWTNLADLYLDQDTLTIITQANTHKLSLHHPDLLHHLTKLVQH